jgi:hypothetical protein
MTRTEISPELRARLHARFPRSPLWQPPAPEPAAAPWELIRSVLAQGRKDGLDDTQLAGGVYAALASHGLLTGGRA